MNQRNLAGKRDSGRYSTTGFSKNIVVVERSHRMSDVLSFCDWKRANLVL